MSAFDQVIRAAGERAAVLARIAENQRTMDQVIRGSVARLVAADRSAAGLAYRTEALIRTASAVYGTWGVAGGGDPE